jgi:hypothetical protein
MPSHTTDIDKIVKKNQFKLRGVLFDISIAKGKFVEISLQKGTKDKKKTYIFQCGGKMGDRVRHLTKGTRLKVWFTIRCSQWEGRWFTNLVLEDFDSWLLNEDKINKQQAIDFREQEDKYSKSLYNSVIQVINKPNLKC